MTKPSATDKCFMKIDVSIAVVVCHTDGLDTVVISFALRLGKVDLVLAFGIWVGLGAELGS